MKFKDEYKSMTDEIHGDKALLHSILNGEAKKKKSFFEKFSHSYVLVSAVACVLIMCTVFLSYNHFAPIGDNGQNISPDVSSISDTPMMVRQIEAPPSDSGENNTEYYGEVLDRIFSISPDASHSLVKDSVASDPLNVFIDYPSKDTPSEIMLSKTNDISALAPDATIVTIDGIKIAITSVSDDVEKTIADNLLK